MGSKAVVIVDLGIGNLRSVLRALERSGAQATITDEPKALASAHAVVVPGQGAFRDCALGLERGFGEALRAFIASGPLFWEQFADGHLQEWSADGKGVATDPAIKIVLLIDHGSAANFVPVNNADDWLHFVLGVGMIALGFLTTRRTAAADRVADRR